jgi:type IV secretory pathway VirB10-like protein
MANLIDGTRPAAPPSPSVAIPASSNGLRGQVTGVTRIGARAGILAVGGVAALVIGIFYGISSGAPHGAGKVSVAPPPQALATSAPLIDNIPGANQARVPAVRRPAAAQRSTDRAAQRPITLPAQAPPAGDEPAQNALQNEAPVPQIAPVAQAAAALAGTADNASAVRAAVAAARAQAKAAAQAHALDLERAARQAPILVQAAANGSAAGQQAAAASEVAQGQNGRSAFPQQSMTAAQAQTTARQAPVSPYEVLAGSVIPATLVTGINSDLPGTLIGQVNQNVYDSKTGQYLLIPSGSKIVGRFDAQVVAGQSRVLVAWQRIIYPDASSIDLGSMSGTDAAGYSGLTGKVDDHTGKLFRNALLTSLIGIGSALAQPRTTVAVVTPMGMVVGPSVGGQVATQVSSQVGQAVQQNTSASTQQPPTIEVRPGAIFNVLVSRDLVLPGPYKEKG